ncbi:MarR family transcriptional regulator [Rhodococcus sp. 05-2255-3B1]|uniref:MarR family winged helix-turn-helix transcriptional regulator n=1 Tax=unclassified Rhodococcus (in: high G+C Gram-positive bacteria) TaxID=192944 RepID=UPI000B9AB329|nr:MULTISPECIES: MarR family transcriptional regulator [unclassified Rhodococcus (in: high G+C Gram-positive bacteria)]OZE02491.1 MarR family transcriptional regulator [Rhodococcus sp. 05-2255-3C]OZE11443.1 MarR family transcriptional regulator [Rhodococcus sp. 05-2255-3B1]OZE13168.1 MarR family transcriptional regulator [Rhodococcus sp. 05-2255-2A2]
MSDEVQDAVDRILQQWTVERPDVDVSPMAVIGRISRAASVLDKRIQVTLAEYGLQAGEFDLIATLRRTGAPHRLTVGQLLDSAMVTSGAITNRLNRLTDKGLIEREIDPTNRRVIIVQLTPAGLDAVDAALPAHVANEEALLTSLTPGERSQLATLLKRMLLDIQQ